MAKGELEVKSGGWGLGSNGTVNRLNGGSAPTHNPDFPSNCSKNPFYETYGLSRGLRELTDGDNNEN